MALDSWQLTFLLQTCDSNFPNGAFAHSFGLESLIDERIVHDASTFRTLLEEWFQLQLVPFDGLAAHLAWACAAENDLEGIDRIAHTLSVSIVPEQTRDGMLKIGKRTLHELKRMNPGGITVQYGQSVLEGKSVTTHAIAMAVAAAELGVSQQDTVTAILFNGLAGMIGSAVRSVPLGQTVGQQLLLESRSWVANIPSYKDWTVADLSSASPVWEISQMNHKHMDGRLFMS